MGVIDPLNQPSMQGGKSDDEEKKGYGGMAK
jgi:hypothetical protein